MSSGIGIHQITVVAFVVCCRCDARWDSPEFNRDVEIRSGNYDVDVDAVRPALDAGWRVFARKGRTYTYCPQHGPTVPMHLVHGGTR